MSIYNLNLNVAGESLTASLGNVTNLAATVALAGPQGIAGPTGPTGPQGATGPIGSTGPVGATGADSTVQGPTGATGPIGATGATGPQGDPATNLVSSVAGKTGAVTLDKSDVALGNADNTSDANKPVSTATQTALDLKADTTALGNYVLKSGDTMTGGLAITNSANGINSGSNANFMRVSGGTATNGASLIMGGSTNGSFPSIGQLRINNSSVVQWSSSVLGPGSNLGTALGTSSLYYSNLYAQRHYFNSTAYIDGATAGQLGVTGTVLSLGSELTLAGGQTTSLTRISGGTSNDGAVVVMGGSTHASIASIGELRIGSSTVGRWTSLGINLGGNSNPTHSLSLQSTATGIALYETPDQSTNYSRLLQFFNTNTNYFTLVAQSSGSATARGIRLQGVGAIVDIRPDNVSGAIAFNKTVTLNNGAIVGVGGGLNQSSSTGFGLIVSPSVIQSSTAGYTALLINPTETSTGSGAKYLIQAQLGGSDRFRVDAATGNIFTTGWLGSGGITPTATIDAIGSNTNRASLRIRSGVAPTSPNDGDIWYDGTSLGIRQGSTTKAVVTGIGTANITVSSTAPSSPAIGDLWVVV